MPASTPKAQTTSPVVTSSVMVNPVTVNPVSVNPVVADMSKMYGNIFDSKPRAQTTTSTVVPVSTAKAKPVDLMPNFGSMYTSIFS